MVRSRLVQKKCKKEEHCYANYPDRTGDLQIDEEELRDVRFVGDSLALSQLSRISYSRD